jgi:hypothetical protein
MVEFFDPVSNKEITIHIEDKLLTKWDKIRGGGVIKTNDDRVYLVDGRERTGKSSFAIQQAKYIDPTFDVSRICFTPEQFLEQIRTAKPGQAVLFDEAFRGLSSKSTRSKTNKAIVQSLMEVGQRNLIIFIVLPTIFLLEIYAAVFRSECLFHVYKIKNKKTGEKNLRAYKIYNYAKKKQLYLIGKTKYFSYAKPKIRLAKGRFFVKKNENYPTGIPYETFDMKSYLDKKSHAFAGSESMDDNEESKYLLQRNLIIKGMYNDFIKSHRKLSAWLQAAGVQLSTASVQLILDKKLENTEMVSE